MMIFFVKNYSCFYLPYIKTHQNSKFVHRFQDDEKNFFIFEIAFKK
ncbi:hypothetical protein AAUPMB_08579 [Pasteurella multocida subsp. multocida str. Anand1_buffalo]|nr:hypothetical protein AAUPMB_08579 [Pasteurella multocida subsp. multocida str. Anand1_buffalo]